MAGFRRTRISRRAAGQPGSISLLRKALFDDLLTIFDSGQPGMSGPPRGHFVWPPGPVASLRKIRMDLSFGTDRGGFTSANTQASINRLSESAEGEKKDQIEEEPRAPLLDLGGDIRLRDGMATISNTKFHAQGADAAMPGAYTLTNKRVELQGRSIRAAIFPKLSRASSRCSSKP